MMSYARSGSQYASLAKLLNCLIALLFMATLAFAALPGFLPLKHKARKATDGQNGNVHPAKFIKRLGYGPSSHIPYTPGATKRFSYSKHGRFLKRRTPNHLPAKGSALDRKSFALAGPDSIQYQKMRKIGEVSDFSPVKTKPNPVPVNQKGGSALKRDRKTDKGAHGR